MTMESNNWPLSNLPLPMEPIIEEEDYLSPTCSYTVLGGDQSISPASAHLMASSSNGSSPHHPQKDATKRKNIVAKPTHANNNTEVDQPNEFCTRMIESKQRLREIYTTEEVDTLVSTLPKDSVPEEWNNLSSEEVVLDANMPHTYLTELAGGTTSARSSKYTYTYESHIDEPEATGIQYTGTTFGTSAALNGAHSNNSTSPTSPHNNQRITSHNGGFSPLNGVNSPMPPPPHFSPQQQFNSNYSPTTHYGELNGYGGDVNDANNIARRLPSSDFEASPTSDLERHSTSTQKVTRVTKITTTRSVRQIPVDPDDIFFDSEGNPVLNSFRNAETNLAEYNEGCDARCNSLGIDLSRTYIAEHEEYSNSPATTSSTVIQPIYSSHSQMTNGVGEQADKMSMLPSSSGIPEVTDVSDSTISLAWTRPTHDGTAGEILGYRVDFRRSDTEDWEPAHDDLLSETECKITNLEPQDSYYFRVAAANCAGFGQPSGSTPPICITNDNSGQILGSGPPRPSRPIVADIGNDRATIEWRTVQPPSSYDGAPIVGYMVEYRPEGMPTWAASNDYPVTGSRYIVENLRPNGEYEFQVLAKDVEGRLSAPSPSSGLVRIRPAVPIRTHHSFSPILLPPGQPQAIEVDSNWVQLEWAPSTSLASPTTNFGADKNSDPTSIVNPDIGYVVECREIGVSDWKVCNSGYSDQPLQMENSFKAENLNADSGYEFRVSTVSLKDGTQSAPSEPSQLIHTRPQTAAAQNLNGDAKSLPPERPSRPEYLDFDGGNSVTICWIPAKSVLPVLGYEVEYRDVMEDDKWQSFSVAPHIVQRCKTTIGNLFRGHQYQFRIFAHNANGRSPPSDPSMLITIGTSLKEAKYVEAERHAAVALLQDEMIRESPPLPDRDDSPPPIYRQPPGSNLQYRDPTLKEVIDYLKGNDQVLIQDASSYLQRLTFNNDAVKEDTRNYGGISVLNNLLKNENPETVRNVCGCLKNLAFGKSTVENKKLISTSGGVAALANVIRQSNNFDVLEEATSALWNISSCDDTKVEVLDKAAAIIVNFVVIPFSGFVKVPAIESGNVSSVKCSNIFRNGVGILRNVSAVNSTARKFLRAQPNLIDAILHYFAMAVRKNQIKSRTVENCVCLLRNISYRVQEVVDPKYDPNSRNSRHNNSSLRSGSNSARERSKSVPSASPKGKLKKLSKKSKKDLTVNGFTAELTRENSSLFPNGKSLGASRLWHPETVKLYLHVLQECTSPEVLEASAAAIQNLAACNFEGSSIVRTTVRTENGLPILSELLQLKEDKVVCAMVTALRNLALDPLNLQEIGKYALPELIAKLPQPGQHDRTAKISDATVGAVLGILYEMVTSSTELTQKIHQLGGTQRLMTLGKSYPSYGVRVCKNATQVLYNMWKHKELHDAFRKTGLKESDFYAGTLTRGCRTPTAVGTGAHHEAATLARPISSQGAERPSMLQHQDQDQQSRPIGGSSNFYDGLGTPTSLKGVNHNFDEYTPSPQMDSNRGVSKQNEFGTTNVDENNTKREPLYASVQKRNGGGGSAHSKDSWV